MDSCAAAIRAAILEGRVAPGDRLPPERELAAQLDVNRLTLRAALAQLQAAGLVAVRHGSGYRVADYRRAGGPDLLGGIAQLAARAGELPEVAADLLLMRRLIARAVLDRIAARADEAARARIAAALDRFAQVAATARDTEAIARADLDVVAALLDATGSTVLQLCLNPVLAVVTESEPLRAAMYRDPASNVAGYRVLRAWLAAPDARAIDAIVAELERRDAATVELLR